MKKGLKKVIVGFMAAMVLSMGCATVCMADTYCNHKWNKYQEYYHEALLNTCRVIVCSNWFTEITEAYRCEKCGEESYAYFEVEHHTNHANKYN